MLVILDSSFARPGSAPIWGGKKGEFRDWTRGGGAGEASSQDRKKEEKRCSQPLNSLLFVKFSVLRCRLVLLRFPSREVREHSIEETRTSNMTCTYCWFSHDVTKFQTSEILILQKFYFHAV